MFGLTNDLWWYHIYGENILKGLVPYRDFFPEYPPLSMAVFTIAQTFGTQWFPVLFYIQVSIFVLIGAFLVKRLGGNHWCFLALVLTLGPLLWERFDIFPAVFSLLSLYFLRERKYGRSYLSLSIATLLKIYPIALLPVLILYRPRRIGNIIFFILPIVIIMGSMGKEGISKLASYHTVRGLQPESVRATLLLMNKEAKIIYNSESKSYELQQ